VTPDPNDPVIAVDEPPAGPPDVVTPPELPPDNPRPSRWIKEAVIVVVVAVLVAVLLRAFVVQTFFIPSGSMEPTLQIGDRILVNKLSYHLHGVDRGDIVVFTRPPTENCGGPTVNDLVKRVIGLPGQTIYSVGNKIFINGHVLAEPYLPRHDPLGLAIPGGKAAPFRFPPGEFYMMGDNRAVSCDSRYWGPIKASEIVGRVVMLLWANGHPDLRFF
jgi:signal peptidase I